MTTLSKQNQNINSYTNLPESSLQELLEEAQALFQVLDSISTKIRDLEKRLSEIKAHFPFSYLLLKEEDSGPRNPDAIEGHMRNAESYTYLGYEVRIEWHLSWEADENSKNFRLFLISRRKEFTVVDVEGNPTKSSFPLVDQIVFKKPLIETDLPTRLKFSEHLHAFIISFKEHLKRYRISIEGRNLGSSGDEVPF